MVFELTAGAGAVCGVIHRLGKLGFIPSYGYDRARDASAGLKLLMWAHVLAAVALLAGADTFAGGLWIGLIFLGAWKLAEEAAGFVVDVVDSAR